MIYPINLQNINLYFWIHKNDKLGDLTIDIFTSPNFIRFCHFCVAYNTKNLY
jgi:hypothetical protein